LVQQRRLLRQELSGLYLYTSTDAATRQRQMLNRRSTQTVPSISDATALQVSPDESSGS